MIHQKKASVLGAFSPFAFFVVVSKYQNLDLKVFGFRKPETKNKPIIKS